MANLMQAGCVSDHSAGVVLRVRATPNAARTEVAGIVGSTAGEGERLQVRLKAPPVEGKANAAACAWAAKIFGVRGGKVSVLRGEKSRNKDLLIEGVEPGAAARVVENLISGLKRKETKKEENDV